MLGILSRCLIAVAVMRLFVLREQHGTGRRSGRRTQRIIVQTDIVTMMTDIMHRLPVLLARLTDGYRLFRLLPVDDTGFERTLLP